MDAKSHAIRDMFSRIAPRYDLLNKALSLRIDRGWRKKAVSYLPDRGPLRILDLCAGTLDLTLAVLERNPQSQVTAVDFSEAMLNEGKKKIPALLKNQVECRVGDAMNLDLPAESFDGAVCGFGIRNVVDNNKTLAEIHRILKLGGRLIVLEFFRPETFDAKLFHNTYGRWVLPRLGGWLSRDPEAYQYLFDSIQGYASGDEFCEQMRKASFEIRAKRPLLSHVAHIMVGDKR